MTRCQSCDGILTKTEEVCYQCGDPVPGRAKRTGSFVPILIAVVVIVSLGFTAYSFL
jgi:hypothetical protein